MQSFLFSFMYEKKIRKILLRKIIQFISLFFSVKKAKKSKIKKMYSI